MRLGTSQLQEASMPAQPRSQQPENGHPLASDQPHRHRDSGAERDHDEDREREREKERDRHDRKDRKQHDKKAKKEAKKAKKARRRAEQGSSASEDEAPDLGAGGAAAGHEPPWLAPHIAVKIIDKHVKGGRCGPLSSVRQPA